MPSDARKHEISRNVKNKLKKQLMYYNRELQFEAEQFKAEGINIDCFFLKYFILLPDLFKKILYLRTAKQSGSRTRG